MSAEIVDRVTGELRELLPVEDLCGSPLERATREEIQLEYGRLRDRYGIEPETALKLATAHVKEAAAAVADDEKRVIADGGYRQTRLDG